MLSYWIVSGGVARERVKQKLGQIEGIYRLGVPCNYMQCVHVGLYCHHKHHGPDNFSASHFA